MVEEYEGQIVVPDVNLYNWPEYLDTIIGMYGAMRDVISSLGRKVSGSSRVAPINLNGEDGPVDDEQISDISHKVGKLIEVYASPKDGETYKRQYKIILRDVGTSSNRELARRTLDFCFSLVSLAQQNNGQQ